MKQDDRNPRPGGSQPAAAGHRERLTEYLVLLLYILVIVVIVLAALSGSPSYSLESFHRTMAAEDLLDGLSRGRQALVGSLRMAPLPTVLLGIAAGLPLVSVSQAVCVIMAAAGAFVLCWYLNSLWRSEGISPAIRALGGIAILGLPRVTMSIKSGESTMLFVALAAAGIGFLMKWLEDRSLRSLAYAGLLFGLALTVRFQGLFLAAGAALIIVAAILSKEPEKGLLEGSGFIFATPIVYMILLWLGGNWLLLGNPLFPLQGVLRSVRLRQAGAAELLIAGGEWSTLALVAVIAVSPFLPALFSKKADFPAARAVALAGAITVASIISFFEEPHAYHKRPDSQAGQVVAYLESNYDNTSFIVTGYTGYEFTRAAGDDKEDAWIHVMHLEQSKLDKIMDDFRGRNVFLLVDTGQTAEGWLNMGIEWVEPWTNIPEQFFLVEKIGSWIVFEVFGPVPLEHPVRLPHN